MVGTLPQTEKFPDKLYFKIGEVCDMTGIKTHTLRFWESEFSAIRPKRAGSNQRLYRKQDVELILKIKKLIYDEGRTIAGARKYLTQEKKQKKQTATRDGSRPAGQKSEDLLKRLKTDLIAIQTVLKK